MVIVGRGVIFNAPNSGEELFADYMGVLYPTGLQTDSTIFFQHENVDKVVYKGYTDEEEERFLDIYGNWVKTVSSKRARVK